ncbi:hypothetical protein PENTCL1PPCAC_6076, partial [Pristionchus entomophagus]
QMETRAQDLSKIPEHKRVLFVLPTGKFDKLPDVMDSTPVAGTLTGAEARSFYEEVLADDHSTSEDVKPSKKSLARKRCVPVEDLMIKEELSERDHHKFLAECTSGELKNVMKWFERGVNLNFSDQYGWTALHCASAAGKTDIVLFLIENGANWDLVESSGKSFVDLANRRTLKAVYAWFEKQSDLDEELEMEEPRGHCYQCGRTYSGSEADHLTNISHIVRMKKQNPSFAGFVIPEWNPGFRLLRKAGWTEDKGLGKERQGQKYPVRTVLKRDRAGFGTSQGRAKVTHFEANDERAVETAKIKSGETKIEREKRLNRERNIARDVRWAFNDPS